MLGPKSLNRVHKTVRKVENNLGLKKTPNRAAFVPTAETLVVKMLENMDAGQTKTARQQIWNGGSFVDGADTNINVVGWGYTGTVTTGEKILCFRVGDIWLACQPEICPS